jgi:hypothetical protein
MKAKKYKSLSKLWVMVVFSLIHLFGCSSIPIGSMFKLVQLDNEALTSLDATEIRARISLDHPAQLTTNNVKLVLRFDYGDSREEEYEFDLIMLEQSTSTNKRWFAEQLKRYHYDFMISERSQRAFKQYQREFTQYGKPQEYYWTVYYYLKSAKHKGDDLTLDLELKLDAEQEYFYLLKGVNLEVR